MTRHPLFALPLVLCAAMPARAQEPVPPGTQPQTPEAEQTPAPPALPARPVPVQAPAEAPVTAQGQEGVNPMADASGRPYHLVKEGENLFRIAYAYGMNIQQIVALNGLKNNTIYVGDKVWLAPPGAKVTLPHAPAKAAVAVTQETEGPANQAEQDEDFVAKAPTGPAMSPQSPTVVVQPRVPHGTMERPVPASQRTIVANAASGQALPSESRFLRQPLPAQEPEIIPLVDAVKVLPMLAKEEARTEWSPRQISYAQFWEKQIVRSAGIPSMAKWDGRDLWLALRPATGAAPVRVVVPGAFLPQEIDTAVLQRWVRAGAVFEFLGHPMYLDGSEPLEAMLRGRLLAPWGFVARTLRVRVPAGPSMVLTL